ncbi:MAG: ribonuclease [Ilumatobacteraceae bacterium]|nr:ribonuclease [Ilumatobacteraceae bacterium]
MTDLVILGSGTPNADVGRSGAAVAIVSDSAGWVMVDAGRAATQRAIDAGLDLTDLRAVFITHHHSDHISDLATLATTRWVAGAGDALVVVVPAGPAERFARTCLDAYDDQCFHGQSDSVDARPTIAVIQFEPSSAVEPVWQQLCWSVDSALVDHHPVSPAVGYRLEVDGVTIAVSGDTAVCDGMHALAHGADVLVHEAVLTSAASAAMLAWNAGATSVGALACAADVRMLVLTHMLPAPSTRPHELNYIDEARQGGWSGPIHIARDLLRFRVGS